MERVLFKVRAPDGSMIDIMAPKDASDEALKAFAAKEYSQRPSAEPAAPAAPDYGQMGWGGVASNAFSNLPSSAGQFASDITAPIHSPIQTAKAIGSLALGVFQKMTPGVQADEAMVDAVGKFYMDRYLTTDGFKKALSTDPVGVLSDLSAVFTGGGMAAAKAPGTIGKVGNVANTVGRFIDPAAMALKVGIGAPKVAGNATKAAIGLMSGVGDAPISEAFKAGLAGGKDLEAFLKNMRDPLDYMAVVDDAKAALAKMRQQKSEAYKTGMIDVANDATILDIGDVQRSLNKSFSENTFKGKFKNDDVQRALKSAQDEIKNWAKLDPAEYRTPEGMDALKQRIGQLIDWENKSASENRALQGVYNTIKGTIEKQSPEYSKIMSDYANMAEEIKQIEKALSLNDKASADTALRKLTSVMRNNVNTNYGQRQQLAEKLQTASGKPLMPSIAGLAMSSLAPRGLAGTGSQLALTGAVGGALTPWALLTAPAQSPRIVGEAAQAAGRMSRPVASAASKLAPFVGPIYKNVAPYSPILGYGAFQSGRIQDQREQPLLRTK